VTLEQIGKNADHHVLRASTCGDDGGRQRRAVNSSRRSILLRLPPVVFV
jgi:hypothetical protein